MKNSILRTQWYAIKIIRLKQSLFVLKYCRCRKEKSCETKIKMNKSNKENGTNEEIMRTGNIEKKVVVQMNKIMKKDKVIITNKMKKTTMY